jgi:ATP-dependent helicase HrpA
MKSLHLGDVAQFPFLEAPSGRAIADGYQLLNELGAVDDANELTPMGRELARLPLDPRVGRMILEARDRNALDEVLVIASGLSVQDVRDRPMDAQQQADQAHAKFDDDKSEFSGYLKLWKWINEARGGAPTLPSARAQKAKPPARAPSSQAVLPVAQRAAQAMAAARRLAGQGATVPPAAAHNPTHKLSNRQYDHCCARTSSACAALREWRDIHTQLLTVVAEHKWKLNTSPPVTSSCTCPCWPACWATSAARWRRKRSTWARAASSSTATPARTCPRSPAAGSWRPSWWRPRACSAAASPPSSRSGWSRWAATC